MLAYQLLFWLLAIFCCFIFFGYSDGLSILLASPTSSLSGILMIPSSLLATILLFRLRNNLSQIYPYPYLIFGFYVGNLSILIQFLIAAGINHDIHWQFPDILFIFIGPFAGLLASYIFGFAFLIIIPSVLSGLILYWFNKRFYFKKDSLK